MKVKRVHCFKNNQLHYFFVLKFCIKTTYLEFDRIKLIWFTVNFIWDHFIEIIVSFSFSSNLRVCVCIFFCNVIRMQEKYFSLAYQNSIEDEFKSLKYVSFSNGMNLFTSISRFMEINIIFALYRHFYLYVLLF